MGVNYMKDICNICSWEYDEECGHEVCAISHDNKWDEIPNEFIVKWHKSYYMFIYDKYLIIYCKNQTMKKCVRVAEMHPFFCVVA